MSKNGNKKVVDNCSEICYDIKVAEMSGRKSRNWSLKTKQCRTSGEIHLKFELKSILRTTQSK